MFGTNKMVRKKDLALSLVFLKILAKLIAIINCGNVDNAQMLNVFLMASHKSESCNKYLKFVKPTNSELPSGSQ